MTEAVDTATTTASGPDSATSTATPIPAPAAPAPVEGGQQQPAAETEATKPAVPEQYTFSDLPEGYALDESSLTEWSGVFKELGLTQEQAQKLVAMDAKRQLAANSPEAAQAAAVESRNQQVTQWESALKADKELGGSNFESVVGIAKEAQAQFGTPELKAMLAESGLGSHPEVVRFFHKVGKQLSEGQLHRTTSEQPAERSLAERMYPNYGSN